MIKQFVINDSGSGVSFLDALETIIENASALDIAVSYVQISGWVLFEKIIRNIEPSNIRLLITDQFGFTHPEAMRRAYKYGLQIRSPSGSHLVDVQGRGVRIAPPAPAGTSADET